MNDVLTEVVNALAATRSRLEQAQAEYARQVEELDTGSDPQHARALAKLRADIHRAVDDLEVLEQMARFSS